MEGKALVYKHLFCSLKPRISVRLNRTWAGLGQGVEPAKELAKGKDLLATF